jgi:FeoB-associated Cys-rich membrane protein
MSPRCSRTKLESCSSGEVMSWNWQDIAALSIVGIAVVYVANLVYQRLRRKKAGACGGGCFGCKQLNAEAARLVSRIGVSDSLGGED